MSEIVLPVKVTAIDFHVKRGPIKSSSGLRVHKVAHAIYDTALTDSAGVSNKTVAAHGLGVFLPAKAIIVRSWFQTITGFTSAASTATVAISMESAGDIFAALACSDGKLSGAGFVTGIQDGTITHMVSATVERELVATVAVQAFTAGKLKLFVEYVQGE